MTVVSVLRDTLPGSAIRSKACRIASYRHTFRQCQTEVRLWKKVTLSLSLSPRWGVKTRCFHWLSVSDKNSGRCIAIRQERMSSYDAKT